MTTSCSAPQLPSLSLLRNNPAASLQLVSELSGPSDELIVGHVVCPGYGGVGLVELQACSPLKSSCRGVTRAEFRRRVLGLVDDGRSVAGLTAELGVSAQTIYNWRNQELIDRGERSGMTSIEAAELAAARRRIAELETENAVLRRANELPVAEEVSPRGGSRPSL